MLKKGNYFHQKISGKTKGCLKKKNSRLWTERALQNAFAIKKYLIENFSDKELLRF